MKVIEIEMDGLPYFVKVDEFTDTCTWEESFGGDGRCKSINVNLFAHTINSKPIYTEVIKQTFESSFDKRKAKKFIIRALAYDPKKQ
jgi:hypothetical protein